MRAVADRAFAAAERLEEIDTRAAQRRHEPGDERRRERRRDTEGQHRAIDRDRFEAREPRGRGERQQADQRPREREARDATGGRQQQALGEELLHETAAACRRALHES